MRLPHMIPMSHCISLITEITGPDRSCLGTDPPSYSERTEISDSSMFASSSRSSCVMFGFSAPHRERERYRKLYIDEENCRPRSSVSRNLLTRFWLEPSSTFGCSVWDCVLQSPG